MQVETARKFYEGPHDASGLALTPGGLMPGSELSWAGVFVPRPGEDFIFGRVIADGAIAHLAFALGGKPIGIDDLKFDRETYEKLLPQHPLYDGTVPDVAAFAARGGKLILWHGDSNPHISPTNSISYYEAVKSTIGEAKAKEAVRFFLLPGVYHCEGGEGPVRTDVLTAIVDWVERGAAAEALNSARRERCAAGTPLSSAREVQRLGRPGAGFVLRGRDARRRRSSCASGSARRCSLPSSRPST